MQGFILKSIFISSILTAISVCNAVAQITTFDEIKGNYGSNKYISWTTSMWGNGFGHKIYGLDPQDGSGTTHLRFANRHNNASWSDGLTLVSNGSVGIGTTRPSALVSIYSANSPSFDIKGIGANGVNGGGVFAVASVNGAYTSIATPGDVILGARCGGAEDLIFSVANANNGAIRFLTGPSCNVGSEIERMTILNDGRVGIGTNAPGSFKLAVEGKIGAREVQVTSASPWPDFVFSSNYKLKSLSEIESFIKTNNHLPGIPSAVEIEKKGGINLGEMQTLLLEKIEELTLHMINLEKQNQQLKNENAEIKKLLKNL